MVQGLLYSYILSNKLMTMRFIMKGKETYNGYINGAALMG